MLALSAAAMVQGAEVTGEMIAAVYGVPVEILWHRGYPWIIPLTDGLEHTEKEGTTP